MAFSELEESALKGAFCFADDHYFLQDAIVVDHDYTGLSERSYNADQQDPAAEEEINAYVRSVTSAVQTPPSACKDQESADGGHQSEMTEDHCVEPNSAEPAQWPSPCWTLETKIEDS